MQRQRWSAAFGVAAVLALASCAPTEDTATKDTLRGHVVAVAAASAAGDFQGALNELDLVAAEASEALADGKISEERFDSVRLAMELVRQDLEAAIATVADAAEQQRLRDEQARLQQQIAELQEQQNQGDGGQGENDKKDEGEKKGESDKKGQQGKGD